MKKFIKTIISVFTVITLMLFSSLQIFASDAFSDTYRFPASFDKARRFYRDFAKITADSAGIPVPGLERVVFPDGSECNTMVPQGLCFAKNYALITAYDSELKFKSLIFVVSTVDNECKGMIVTPDKNHSGGICFDGKSVWVARSKENEIGRIDFSEIEKAAENGIYVMKKYRQKLSCDTAASFLTYFDGCIYVGLYNAKSYGKLTGYKISDSKLLKTSEYRLPMNVQGGAFTKYGEKTVLVLSQSFGRINSSILTLYELKGDKPEKIKQFIIPPMAEELEFKDGVLYIMFESAATKYSTKLRRCLFPVDRVCSADIAVLADTKPGRLDSIILFFNRIMAVIAGIFA